MLLDAGSDAPGVVVWGGGGEGKLSFWQQRQWDGIVPLVVQQRGPAHCRPHLNNLHPLLEGTVQDLSRFQMALIPFLSDLTWDNHVCRVFLASHFFL